MTTESFKTVAKQTYDNLVIEPQRQSDVKGITIVAGQGELKRGAIMAENSDGKFVILGTTTTIAGEGDAEDTVIKHEADCILAQDVDATTETTAVAYSEGKFNEDALSVKKGYTLAKEDIATLRGKNITLGKMLDV